MSAQFSAIICFLSLLISYNTAVASIIVQAVNTGAWYEVEDNPYAIHHAVTACSNEDPSLDYWYYYTAPAVGHKTQQIMTTDITCGPNFIYQRSQTALHHIIRNCGTSPCKLTEISPQSFPGDTCLEKE